MVIGRRGWIIVGLAMMLSHVPHYFYLAGFKHVCLIFKRILDDEHIRHEG